MFFNNFKPCIFYKCDTCGLCLQQPFNLYKGMSIIYYITYLDSLRLFNISVATFLFQSLSIIGELLQGNEWTSCWYRKNHLISGKQVMIVIWSKDWLQYVSLLIIIWSKDWLQCVLFLIIIWRKDSLQYVSFLIIIWRKDSLQYVSLFRWCHHMPWQTLHALISVDISGLWYSVTLPLIRFLFIYLFLFNRWSFWLSCCSQMPLISLCEQRAMFVSFLWLCIMLYFN